MSGNKYCMFFSGEKYIFNNIKNIRDHVIYNSFDQGLNMHL